MEYKLILLCKCVEEKSELFKMLSESGTKPALITGYSDSYVPKTSLPEFQQPLLMLYDHQFFFKFSYIELLKKCESIELTITPKMALSIENESKQQYCSDDWFNYRSGRKTASRMKSVCHSSAANASQSLIKQICY